MNITARYLLWAVGLLFAMMPLALPVAGPHQWSAIFTISSYAGSLPDLILLCITICVISIIDVMEVFALATKATHKPRPLYVMIAMILLCLLMVLLFCFGFWYASYKLGATVSKEAALLAMPMYIISSLVLSFACRTIYLLAEG